MSTDKRQSERRRSLGKPGGETTLVERLRARFDFTKAEAAVAVALVAVYFESSTIAQNGRK
jgi:hypothetical protein